MVSVSVSVPGPAPTGRPGRLSQPSSQYHSSVGAAGGYLKFDAICKTAGTGPACPMRDGTRVGSRPAADAGADGGCKSVRVAEWQSGRVLDMNHVAVEMRDQVLVGPTMQDQASLAGRGTIFDCELPVARETSDL